MSPCYGEAAKQIAVAAYVVTDHAVVEALRAAAVRGVKVRVWLDAGEEARRSANSTLTAQLGGQVQGLEIRSKQRQAAN